MKVTAKTANETNREYALRVIRDNIISLDIRPGSLIGEQEIAKEQSERSGIIKMRSQFSYYLKGRRNSAAIRNSIMQCTNKDQIKRLLESVDFT